MSFDILYIVVKCLIKHCILKIKANESVILLNVKCRIK